MDENRYKILMRTNFGLTEWRTAHVKPSLAPLVYKQPFKNKWLVFKSVGLIGLIKLYRWEKANG